MLGCDKMTLIGHIAAGVICSKASPAVAFISGVGSHAAMDYLLPEYRGWPPSRNKLWWAWQATGSALFLYYTMPWALWGIIGAVLPDIIDGVYALINPQAWQKGTLLCPWHRARTQRDMTWAMTLALELLLIIGGRLL